MAKIEHVTVHMKWVRSDEPDGRECYACGDSCYLVMHELTVTQGKHVSKNGIAICDSCRSRVEDQTFVLTVVPVLPSPSLLRPSAYNARFSRN